jgi:predicted metallopeptidase
MDRSPATVVHPTGFDFTVHVGRLCDDFIKRLDDLRHIDMSRVALGFKQTRTPRSCGMYASLTPLRFLGGESETVRRGRRWGMQRVRIDGRDMLYLLNFYLPRFCDLPFQEKLTTVVHELWHISPQFDGDLRRYAGRCYAHSGSQRRYDARAAAMVRRWLELGPAEELYDFLRLDFRGLSARYGKVFGRRIRSPRLIPLEQQ